MNKLQIAPGLSLDADYVGGGTFALLAKKGAGKTYTGRVMAEEMWSAKVPFVALDPMGAWWGLRSSADGRGEGIPVAIFGGEHGDAPLERGAGALMADLVVDERLSMILDMGAFGTRAAERQFALEFLERLYRRNRELVHLFIDEADLFAPQKPQSGDQQLLGITENIVRRGRNKGIGITLITQRPAVLNKDVLTQVDGLVAMRIVGLTDREAIDKWVEGHGDDPAHARTVKGTLASLANGECWWWIPELGVLKQVKVRQSRTFDSSPTRKRGEAAREPKAYADVDMDVIEQRMAATIERAKAEDPKELRKQITQLKRELAQRPTEKEIETVTETVEVPVLANGTVDQLSEVVASLGYLVTAAGQAAAEIRSELQRVAKSPARGAAAPPREQASPRPPSTPQTAPIPTPAAEGDVQLGKAHRAILSVLAQRQGLITGKRQLAVMTGYSHRGGGFNNPLSALRTSGLVVGSDPIAITDAGRDAIDALGWEPLPEGAELLEHWISQLGKAHGLILRELAAVYPDPLSKEELAERTGYAPTGGGFNNPLSKLRTLELVEGSGWLRLTDSLGEQIIGVAA